MSGNNTKRKYSDTLEVLGAVSPKKDDNPLKKYRIPRISRTKSVKLLISIIILLRKQISNRIKKIKIRIKLLFSFIIL